MKVHVSVAPTWLDPAELGFPNAIGPRVEEPGSGLIAYHPRSAPCEDVRVRTSP
jgi:hypothetical protein